MRSVVWPTGSSAASESNSLDLMDSRIPSPMSAEPGELARNRRAAARRRAALTVLRGQAAATELSRAQLSPGTPTHRHRLPVGPWSPFQVTACVVAQARP